MNDFRHSLWFRFSCTLVFAAASFVGTTHFHLGDLNGNSGELAVESVESDCACTLHSHSPSDHNNAPNPTDSEHCPVCKLLAQLASDIPVADDLFVAELVSFSEFSTTRQHVIAASSVYFGRGPPANC